MRFKYFIYILLFMALSCVKEKDTHVPDPEGTVTTTIPFKAVVQGSQDTRASISDDFGTGSYIFQTGDRLFVVDSETHGTKLYGVLTLIDGEDTGSGIFEGTLTCVDFTPIPATELSAILVGPNAASGFYTFSGSGDKITGGPSYPSSLAYISDDPADYVKKYSHFTATSRYDAKSFTLTQQTVFLKFSIENIAKTSLDGGTGQSTVTVSIKKGEPLTVVRTFSGIALEGGSYFANAYFIGVLAPTDDISSGQIFVENSTPISCGDPIPSDLDLEANTYYNVHRSLGGSWDGFTIRATTSDTRITFKYSNIQYSINRGASWQDAPLNSPIPATGDPALSNGEELWVRGTNTAYANTGGSTPLFTTTNTVKIYGDIMSLMCEEGWVRMSEVGTKAFYQAFKGVAVDIPSDKNLVLSATTLEESCYQGMFQGCTSLTKAPLLPATIAAALCYKSMFDGCTALVTPPPSLPATTVGTQAYYQMFQGCTSLTYTPSFPGEKGTLSGSQNYYQMFNLCSALTTTSGKLFTDDTVLTEECFHGMFRHCSKLVNVPLDFLPSLNMAKWCYRGMFEKAVFTEAPVLPATTLVDECYRFMFNTCTRLTKITCLAENPNSGIYTTSWVGGGVPTGSAKTFVKSSVTKDNVGPDLTKWPRGANGIPTDWTVQNYVAPTP